MRQRKLLAKLKNVKKRVYAIALSVAILATAIPTGFMQAGNANAEGESGVDITANMISHNMFDLQNMKATIAGEVKDLVLTDGVYALPTGTSINSVEKLSGALHVALPNATTNERDEEVFQEGNYFRFVFPSEFKGVSLDETVAYADDKTTALCNYDVSFDETLKAYVLTGTFTENVEPEQYIDKIKF